MRPKVGMLRGEVLPPGVLALIVGPVGRAVAVVALNTVHRSRSALTVARPLSNGAYVSNFVPPARRRNRGASRLNLRHCFSPALDAKAALAP